MEPGAESATTESAAQEDAAQTLSEIAAREDFLATGDPALREESDRGRVQLLDYTQLYELWERQHWATQDLDFSADRVDWQERFDDEERFQRMYGLSAFFIGERHSPDLALVPIGGFYTMDRTDAVAACELIGAPTVIPCHYDTFPPVETDAEIFKAEVERATDSAVLILAPGEKHTL